MLSDTGLMLIILVCVTDLRPCACGSAGELVEGRLGSGVFPEEVCYPNDDAGLWVTHSNQQREQGVVPITLVPLHILLAPEQ